MKDIDFCNPCLHSHLFEDNVDNFALVSIMISLIYRFEFISKNRTGFWHSLKFFFGENDFKDFANSSLYKSIDKCYSWDYELSSFVLCLKQQLRSVFFSKQEIMYLFKHKLTKEIVCNYNFDKSNVSIERKLSIIVPFCCVAILFAPFLLLSYTHFNVLEVTFSLFVTSVILFLGLFICASFRPNKTISLQLNRDNIGGFGCLGAFAAFMPILFMSDSIVDLLNNNIKWLHMPYYDEHWYITVVVWFISYLTILTISASTMGEIYDSDTFLFDVRNYKYIKNRDKFIKRLQEDEYNYNYSKEYQDSRLYSLLCVNVFAIIGFIYVIYCFLFMRLDLIIANIIIATLSLATTILVKPILKEKYLYYSHNARNLFLFTMLIKALLPLVTIPFAFAGFTNFLNETFNLSLYAYDLGLKELIINAVLYLFIYCIPFAKEDYL